VVVDNRPGAGGNIGLTVVAKAPADGYTLGVGAAGALSANVSLYPQMPFDPVKDFKPVTHAGGHSLCHRGQPVGGRQTQRELIALAKAQPGKLSMAHGGNGTAMHLSSQLFAQMADIKFSEVPYKGSGPAALDVLGGQVPLAVVDLPSALQHIKAGKLIAYAVTSPQRLPQLPDVPTVAEAGLAGYDSTGWFGVVAPAGTPQAVVARLNAEITAALNDDTIKATLRAQGVEPAPTHARGLRGLHPQRNREVGAGHPHGQHQTRMTPHCMASTPTSDVLIAGAGPVGLTLAMDLASAATLHGGRAAPLRRAAQREVQPRQRAQHGDLPAPGRGAQTARAGLPADYPNDVVFRTSVTGTSSRASPSPAGATATPTPRAPTAGGPRPSRRTASTRSTSNPCCCATPPRCRA
jgi:tripartite-type tricarboxylate transporter receptor subunit TctC